MGETKRETDFLDKPKATLIKAILDKAEKLKPDKAIFPRSKREASFTSLSSIENENTETIFKRIEKLNPEKAKELLREKREVRESLKEDIESIFTIIEKLDPNSKRYAKSK